MFKAFGACPITHHAVTCLGRLPGLKPQPCHVPRYSGDSGKAVVSPFVDEKRQPPVTLTTAATKFIDTGAVEADTTEVKNDSRRCGRVHFPELLNLPPVYLEKGTCVRTATRGDPWGSQDADRSPIWNHWREICLPGDHVTDSCVENSLFLQPSVFSSPDSPEPALVVLDDDKGASLTGHVALGDSAERKKSTRKPRVSSLSSDESCPPEPSTSGTMSGTSSFTSPDSPEPALVVPDGDNCASLTGLAALGEGAVGTESKRDPVVSLLSSDDCLSFGTSMPGTMSGTSRFSTPD